MLPTLIIAYLSIVVLTVTLVVMNAHSVVTQYFRDRNQIRLNAYLVTLAVVGSLIIVISGNVVDRVIMSQETILKDGANRF